MRTVTSVGIALFLSAVIATTGHGQTNVIHTPPGQHGPVRYVQYSGGTEQPDPQFKTVGAWLTAKAGVDFPPGTSAKVVMRGGTRSLIMVTNTEENLEKITAFLKNRGWTISTPDANTSAVAQPLSGNGRNAVVLKTSIEEKMSKIIIPEINFRQANIRDVVDFLNKSAKENDKETSDPELKGVKITLNLPESAIQPCPAITFSARYVSLGAALGVISPVAGLEYDIDSKANVVVLLDKNALIRREYPASSKAIARLTESAGGDLRRALQGGQLPTLPANAKVNYDAKAGMLIVESTPGSQRAIAGFLAERLMQLMKAPMEVQLEVTVLKISASMTKQIQTLVPTDANERYPWTENMGKAAQMLRQSATSQKLYVKRLTSTAGVEARDSQKTGGRNLSVSWMPEVSAATEEPRAVCVTVAISIDDHVNQKNEQRSGIHSSLYLYTGKSGVLVSTDGQYAVCLTVSKCEPGKDTDAAPTGRQH